MTTKRKSSAQKSPVKKAKAKVKAVAKKISKPAKKTSKKSTIKHRASVRRDKKSTGGTEAHFSAPAFSLIDQAAGFLQRAVSQADSATAYERKAIRDNVLSFVDNASKRLMQAIDEDSTPSRKRSR